MAGIKEPSDHYLLDNANFKYKVSSVYHFLETRLGI